MTWHNLPTYADTDVPDENDLNDFLDNLEYLRTPNFDSYEETNDGANITTTSTNFAAISANFQLSLTTVGEHVLVIASVVSQLAQFDVRVDGTRLGGTPSLTGAGSFGQTGSSFQWPHVFITVLQLNAGAHTFDLEYKAISGTATIFTRFRPRFHVRKLSL